MTTDKNENDDALVNPGSTATGSGTSIGEGADIDPVEEGTTEADVSDGSEQKLPRID